MTLLMTRRASAVLRVAAAAKRAASDAWEREAYREHDSLTVADYITCADECWRDAQALDARAEIAADLCTRCGMQPGDVLTDDGAAICAGCAVTPCGQCDARPAEVVSPDCAGEADALASPLVCRECASDSEQAAADERRERGEARI